MLIKKEILKQLKKDNVDMGKNPDRTFSFYREKGLLPEPIGFRKKAPLYPDNTPWIIRDIRFAQLVEKRTVDEIRRTLSTGQTFEREQFEILGLKENPLNIFYKNVHHGKYHCADSDILVAIYEEEIVLLLVEGIWGGIKDGQDRLNSDIRILEKRTLTMEEYGEFVKEQAINRAMGEGMMLEEEYLLERLFG